MTQLSTLFASSRYPVLEARLPVPVRAPHGVERPLPGEGRGLLQHRASNRNPLLLLLPSAPCRSLPLLPKPPSRCSRPEGDGGGGAEAAGVAQSDSARAGAAAQLPGDPREWRGHVLGMFFADLCFRTGLHRAGDHLLLRQALAAEGHPDHMHLHRRHLRLEPHGAGAASLSPYQPVAPRRPLPRCARPHEQITI